MEISQVKNSDSSWKRWLLIGLAWGLVMLVTMNLIYPFLSGEALILKDILISIPIWVIIGLGFGSVMKLYKDQSIEKSSKQE